MSTSTLAIPIPVCLVDFNSYALWIQEIRAIATVRDVWTLINPDHTPIQVRAYGALENPLFHKEQMVSLDVVHATIINSIDQKYSKVIHDSQTPYEQLVALKLHLKAVEPKISRNPVAYDFQKLIERLGNFQDGINLDSWKAVPGEGIVEHVTKLYDAGYKNISEVEIKYWDLMSEEQKEKKKVRDERKRVLSEKVLQMDQNLNSQYGLKWSSKNESRTEEGQTKLLQDWQKSCRSVANDDAKHLAYRAIRLFINGLNFLIRGKEGAADFKRLCVKSDDVARKFSAFEDLTQETYIRGPHKDREVLSWHFVKLGQELLDDLLCLYEIVVVMMEKDIGDRLFKAYN